MRYFLDTEFIEDGRTIDLVSVGLVAEDGREFYAESSQAELNRANDWVKANVLPHLSGPTMPRTEIARRIVGFVGQAPEFWGYYADYDWVLLCQLYGRMIDLPESWPMFCMDLKQLAVSKGDPRLPEQISTEHHALADARWNRDVHGFLEGAAAGSATPTDERSNRCDCGHLYSSHRVEDGMCMIMNCNVHE